MKSLFIVALGSIASLAGCSNGGSTRSLSGQLDTTQLPLLARAQVVAQASDGRVFRAPISSTGAFQISLPVGVRYSLRFANATSNASLYDSFAVLAVRQGQHAFNWTAGGAVSLGRVGTSTTSTGLKTLSESETESGTASGSTGSAETEDDTGEVEDDGVKACSVSSGAAETEVESEHDLLTEVDSTTSAADDKEMDDEHDQSCSSTTGTNTPATSGTVAP